jgi:hypothetical protein
MTSSQLSGSAPPDWSLHPKLATIVDRRDTSVENDQKGDRPGNSLSPHWDPALSAKVTTGGLSAPISRWKVECHFLWIDGFQGLLSRLHIFFFNILFYFFFFISPLLPPPPLPAPLLNINIEEPQVAIIVEK